SQSTHFTQNPTSNRSSPSPRSQTSMSIRCPKFAGEHVDGTERGPTQRNSGEIVRPFVVIPSKPPRGQEQVSGPRVQDHVERSFCGPPHRREPARGDHLAQLRLACLRAKRSADVLR